MYNRAHCKISTTKYMGKNFKTPQRNCHYKKNRTGHKLHINCAKTVHNLSIGNVISSLYKQF